MRVITGSARGRRLREVNGEGTRPTAARVKEGLFSAIQFEITGRKVLDLFAGTGQLGIECLSRGASSAVFVDASPAAAAVVRENLRSAGLEERARVIAGDALAYLRRRGERFDLVFLDPPYETGLLEQAAADIASFDILLPCGIIAAEHPASELPPILRERFRLRRTYRYGKIAVTLCQRREDGRENGDDIT